MDERIRALNFKFGVDNTDPVQLIDCGLGFEFMGHKSSFLLCHCMK